MFSVRDTLVLGGRPRPRIKLEFVVEVGVAEVRAIAIVVAAVAAAVGAVAGADVAAVAVVEAILAALVTAAGAIVTIAAAAVVEATGGDATSIRLFAATFILSVEADSDDLLEANRET